MVGLQVIRSHTRGRNYHMKKNVGQIKLLLSAVLVIGLLSGLVVPVTSRADQILAPTTQWDSPLTPQGFCDGFTDTSTHDYFCLSLTNLTIRGAVGGYTTSPPCTTGTPCFIPYNNVTRGQFSKMIVLY